MDSPDLLGSTGITGPMEHTGPPGSSGVLLWDNAIPKAQATWQLRKIAHFSKRLFILKLTKYQFGQGKCHFGILKKIIPHSVANQHGVIQIKRQWYAWINSYNCVLASCFRSNHDISWIPTIARSLSVMYYITNYAGSGGSIKFDKKIRGICYVRSTKKPESGWRDNWSAIFILKVSRISLN